MALRAPDIGAAAAVELAASAGAVAFAAAAGAAAAAYRNLLPEAAG